MLHSIILLRHGESADKQPFQTDFVRTLTIRGVESIQRLGMHLMEEQMYPDCILSSNSVRTVQTTQALSNVIGIPESSIIFDPNLYYSSDEEYIKCISQVEESIGLLMVVGHNPMISSTIGRLTGQYSKALHAGQAALIQITEMKSKPIGKFIRLIGPFLD